MGTRYQGMNDILLSQPIACFTSTKHQIMKGVGRAAKYFHSDLSGGVARIDVGDKGDKGSDATP